MKEQLAGAKAEAFHFMSTVTCKEQTIWQNRQFLIVGKLQTWGFHRSLLGPGGWFLAVMVQLRHLSGVHLLLLFQLLLRPRRPVLQLPWPGMRQRVWWSG